MSMIVILIHANMEVLVMIWLMTSVAHVHMELLDFSVKSTSMNASMVPAIMEELVLTKLEAMNANVDQDMLGHDVRVMSMNV